MGTTSKRAPVNYARTKGGRSLWLAALFAVLAAVLAVALTPAFNSNAKAYAESVSSDSTYHGFAAELNPMQNKKIPVLYLKGDTTGLTFLAYCANPGLYTPSADMHYSGNLAVAGTGTAGYSYIGEANLPEAARKVLWNGYPIDGSGNLVAAFPTASKIDLDWGTFLAFCEARGPQYVVSGNEALATPMAMQVRNWLKNPANLVDPPAGFSAAVYHTARVYNIHLLEWLEYQDLFVPTVDVPVAKAWQSDKPSDRPASVTVKLFANGVDTGKTATLTAPSWKATFEDLAYADKNGTPITYTIVETNIPAGYTATPLAGSAKDGFTFSNIGTTPDPDPEPTTVFVKKVDENGNDLPGARLHIENESGEHVIPAWISDGSAKEIGLDAGTYYLVEEKAPANYEIDGTGRQQFTVPAPTPGVTPSPITVTMANKPSQPQTVTVKAAKYWEGNIPEGTNPMVMVALTKNGVTYGTPKPLPSHGSQCEWTNLPKVDENGNDIAYGVEEVFMPAGSAAVRDPQRIENSDGSVTFVLTNTFPKSPIGIQTKATYGATRENHGPAETNVTITDTVTYENLVPGTTYTLYGVLHKKNDDGTDGGVLKDAQEQNVSAHATFTPTQPNGTQEVTFTFDASKLAGKDCVVFEYLYDTVLGEVVATHENIGDSGQTITFDNPEPISITATKKWTLANGITPVDAPIDATVTLTLEANGATADVSNAVQTIDCAGSPEKKVTWNDLPQKDAQGDTIVYTVKETNFSADGFALGEVTGNAEQGFVVTNVKQPEPDPSVKPATLTLSASKSITGDNVDINDPKYKNAFTFNISGVAGAPVPSRNEVTNNGSAVNFGPITFTKAGTYTYTIREVVPAAKNRIDGVTYDTTPKVVTVTVEERKHWNERVLAVTNVSTNDPADPEGATITASGASPLKPLPNNVNGYRRYNNSDDTYQGHRFFFTANGDTVPYIAFCLDQSASMPPLYNGSTPYQLASSFPNDLAGKEELIKRIGYYGYPNDASNTLLDYTASNKRGTTMDDETAFRYATNHAVWTAISGTSYRTSKDSYGYLVYPNNAFNQSIFKIADKILEVAQANSIPDGVEVRAAVYQPTGSAAYQRLVRFDVSYPNSFARTLGAFANTYNKPDIHTTASNLSGNGNIPVAETAQIKDVVVFENLTVGKTYTLSGTLHKKSDGQNGPAIHGATCAITDASNATFTSDSMKFTPTKPDGSVTLVFTVDTRQLAGESVVVYETATPESGEPIVHAEITDEAQTVVVDDATIDIEGTKTWDDSNNRAGKRPQSIVVRLLSNGQPVALKEVTPNAQGTWAYKFEDLPEFDSNGGKINYTVSEYAVAGYSAEYPENTYDIKNTYTPEKTSVTVTKAWVDGNNKEGKRATEVTVHLMNGTTEVASAKLNESNKWTHTFTGLDTHDANDQPITYTVTEDAVEGYTTAITGNAAAGFVVTNTRPTLATTASASADNVIKEVAAGQSVKIYDTVEYANLEVGKTYTFTGTLYDKAAGKVIEGVTATATHTPANASECSGTIVLEFTLDTRALQGKQLVAFESLSVVANVVSEHKDPNDEDQTVTVEVPTVDVPVVKKWVDENNVETTPGESAIIARLVANGVDTDKVTVLHAPSWAGTFTDLPKLDDQGNPITYTVKEAFYDSQAYDVEVTEAAGAFTITNKEKPDAPTPEIGTTATDSVTNDHIAKASETTKIVDTVAYTNLKPGKTYKMRGQMHKKSDGKPVGQVVEKEFTVPADSNGSGTVQLEFTIDTSELAGDAVVAFEACYEEDGLTLVASHEELDDPGQTVVIPDAKTNASDADGDSYVAPTGEAKVVDVVTYTNLLPGKTYTVSGTLYDKATGEPLLVNGQQVTASKQLKLAEGDSPNGQVELTFTFDASALAGKAIVAFETVTYENKEVAVHADITDADQTVYVPEIGTTASAVEPVGDNPKVVGVGTVKVKDIVEYKGLVPGKEYTLFGQLMHLTSGGPQEIDTATTTFTASATGKGSQELVFTVDTRKLQGEKLVAFETLTCEGKFVTDHKDPTDPDQTVEVDKPKTKVEGAKTWSDGNNADNKRPSQITVRLHANGKEVQHATVTDPWTYKFDNLDKLDANGQEISYTVTEDAVSEYATAINGYNITNSYTPGKTSVAVTKEWDDNENAASDRPTSITVKLLADGNPVDTVNLTQANNWTHTFTELAEGPTYTVEEVSVPGYTTTTTGDAEQGYVIKNTKPTVTTNAANEQGGKELAQGETVKVVDKVTYTNLKPGTEYTLKGDLHKKVTNPETGEVTDGGIIASAEKKFTPTEANGSIDLEFTVKTADLKGETLVVFENVLEGEVSVATHFDITDNDQTVYVPEIGTTATADGEHIAKAEGTVEIVDVVAYKGLVPGKSYTMEGELVKKSDYSDARKTVLATAGKGFTASATGEGTVELVFHVNAADLAGDSAVAFETCKDGTTEVATHADINDEDQTVHFPEAQTNATDGADGDKHVAPTGKATVVDVVTYTNLLPGKTYTVSGTLYDKATGQPLLVGGQPVTASEQLVLAEDAKPDGQVKLTFTFDARELAGKAIVAFETVTYNGKEVAVHADINDVDQTVYVPEIGTTATDAVTGDHIALAGGAITINDVAEYKGLVPGKSYKMVGQLHRKSNSEQTVGNPTELVFTASATGAGAVTLSFKVDAADLVLENGEFDAVVAYEQAWEVDASGKPVGEVPAATHEDPNDGEQTVVVPDAKTNAYDNADGDKTVAPEAKVTIVDTVTYRNLIPGETYTVSGKLVDKDTGADCTFPGAAATKTFTATQANESIDLKFTFDARDLAGQTLVAFEQVFYKGNLVAVHEDLNDVDQTVKVEEPEVPTYEPEIEKYVNKDVHANIVEFDRTFDYDVVAYVTPDADTVTITDTLVDSLQFTGTPRLFALGAEVDHAVGGSVSYGVPVAEALYTAVPEKQTLTVTIPDATSLRGQWIKLAFQAEIKPSFHDTVKLAIAGDEAARALCNWAPVKGNSPVTGGAEEHEGITNDARYTIGVGGNSAKYSDTSNTVTVVPETTDVKVDKVWKTNGVETAWPANATVDVKVVATKAGVRTDVAGKTAKLDANKTAVTFDDLPCLEGVVYEVVEASSTDGWTSAVTSDENGFHITNSKGEEFETEKYVNSDVTFDFVNFDQTFEFEVLAYITNDGTELTVTDELDSYLMFAADPAIKVYDLGTENNHQVNGTVTGTSNEIDPASAVADIQAKKLTVVVDKLAERNLRGHWVKVAFMAQIDPAAYEAVAAKIAEKAADPDGIANNGQNGKGWMNISDNMSVLVDEAHDGVPNKATATLKAENDGTYELGTNTVTVEPKTTQVEVSKSWLLNGAAAEWPAGASVVVNAIGKKDAVVATDTLNASKQSVVFDNLPCLDGVAYTVAEGEVTGADGWALGTVEGENGVFAITNTRYENGVHISKTDLGGKEVPGAGIELYKAKQEGEGYVADGGAVDSWTSTTEDHVVTLEPGTYVMRETVAPAGFQTVTTDIVFTVDEQGTVTLITTEVDGGRVKVDETTGTLVLEDAPEAPQVEKYVNKDVHADLVEFDRTFTYDVMAYVPGDAVSIVITDPLNNALEFVSSEGDIEKTVVVKASNDQTDHKAASAGTGTVSAAGERILANASISGQNLTVTVNDEAAIAKAHGKWVQFTFTAKIKDSIRTIADLGTLAPVNADDPVESALEGEDGHKAGNHTGVANQAFYTVNIDNQSDANPGYAPDMPTNEVTVIPETEDLTITKQWVGGKASADELKAALKVLANGAAPNFTVPEPAIENEDTDEWTVTWTGLPKLIDTTYTVDESAIGTFVTTGAPAANGGTIVNTQPGEPQVEKYVDKDVHSDIVCFDREFTYDVIAYVPRDATAIELYDELKPIMHFASTEEAIAASAVVKAANDHTAGSTVAGADAATNPAASIKATATIDGQKLTVRVDGDDLKAALGKYVQVTFKAQLNDNIRTMADLTQEVISNNGIVVTEIAEHEGVANTAQYQVFVGNNDSSKYEEQPSNTVTVVPETTEVKADKTWKINGVATNWPAGETVDVKVVANKSGQKADAAGKTATLTADAPSATFADLPCLEGVVYEVVETSSTEGWESAVASDENGFHITNSKGEQPQEEKYVNGDVTFDFDNFDQGFEFEIMAYITNDGTKLTVNDQLDAYLAFADDPVIQVFDMGTENDHEPMGTVAQAGTKIDLAEGDIAEANAETKKLTVVLDRLAERNLRQHWVKVTFNAQIDPAAYAAVAAKIAEKAASGEDKAANGQNGKGWMNISDNMKVLSQKAHDGVPNKATGVLEVDNGGSYSLETNTVTVEPKTTQVSAKKAFDNGWPAGVDSVAVQVVTNDGTPAATATVNGQPATTAALTAAAPSVTFADLPCLEGVTYAVVETNVPAGYTPVITGSAAEGYTITNTKPEIEKYVNQDVHADLSALKQVFEYDVVAFVTADADKVVISDQLVSNLEFACAAEDVQVFNLGSSVNHKTNGVFSGKSSDASVAQGNQIDASLYQAAIDESTKTLSVTIDDATSLRGQWVRVHFAARISADAIDEALKGAYCAVDAAENAPVLSDKGHDGIDNTATYTIEVNDEPKYENIPSNTVTVKPNETKVEVEKVWQATDGSQLTADIPEAVVVALLANGESTGKTAELNAANNWRATFENLPVCEVDDSGNAVSAPISYTVDELAVPAGFNKTVSGNAAEGYTITNTKIGTDSITIEGSKTLADEAGNPVAFDDAEFSFQLFEVVKNGNEETEKLVSTVTNTAGSFEFNLDYDHNDVGLHLYRVREVAGVDGTIVYDDSTRTFAVEVMRLGAQITATRVATSDTVAFANVYKVPETAPVQVAFEGAKALENADLASYDGKFSFQIAGEAGTLAAENNGSAINFGAMTFTESGTYEFTATETAIDAQGIAGATAAKNIVVTVTEVLDSDTATRSASHLEADVSIDGGEPVHYVGMIGTDAANLFNVGTFTNVKGEVEKYVNGNVDATLANAKEIFTYDVIGYVAADATKVTVSDELVSVLEFVDGNGNATVNGADAVRALVVKDANDHTVGGTVAAPASATIDNYNAQIVDGANLVVTVDDPAELAKVAGKWIQLTFDARIKGNFATVDELRAAAGSDFDLVVTNKTVAGGAASHDGIVNDASYTVELPNKGTVTDESNTVTVEPTYTKLDVNKVWKKADGSALTTDLPKFVTVKLLADGADTGLAINLNATNGWAGTFAGLPEYALDANGRVPAGATPIVYTIDEVDVPGFVKSIDGTTVTNTKEPEPEPEKVNVSVTKTWVGNPPASLNVTLTQDGAAVETVQLNAGNNWTYTWTDLVKGPNYSVTEDNLEAYTRTSFNRNVDEAGNVTVAFENTEKTVVSTKIDVIVSKIDATTSAELPGATLTITDAQGNEVVTFVSGTEPRKVSLEPGTYTLTEVTAPLGYQVAESITFTVDNNGLVGSDKVVMADQPEQTIDETVGTEAMTVHKAWYNDQNIAEYVPVQFVAEYSTDGINWVASDKTVTVTGDAVDKDGMWTARFEKLPAKVNGEAVQWRAVESKTQGYEQAISTIAGPNGMVASNLVENPGTPVAGVVISKYASDTKQLLAGAKLQLLQDGKVLQEWTTTTTPYRTTLPAGTYVLHEVSAPDGYNVAKDVEFVIDRESTVDFAAGQTFDPEKVVAVDMTDQKKPSEKPKDDPKDTPKEEENNKKTNNGGKTSNGGSSNYSGSTSYTPSYSGSTGSTPRGGAVSTKTGDAATTAGMLALAGLAAAGALVMGYSLHRSRRKS